MLIDRKRYRRFQTVRLRGSSAYELRLYARGVWDIPLQYGGRLAMTARSRNQTYEVSFARLPADVQDQVRKAVAHIEANGTPMDNDEHVFGPDYGNA